MCHNGRMDFEDYPAPEGMSELQALRFTAHQKKHAWTTVTPGYSAKAMGMSEQGFRYSVASLARSIQEGAAKMGSLVNIRPLVLGKKPLTMAVQSQPAYCADCDPSGSPKYAAPKRTAVISSPSNDAQASFSLMPAELEEQHRQLHTNPTLLDDLRQNKRTETATVAQRTRRKAEFKRIMDERRPK